MVVILVLTVLAIILFLSIGLSIRPMSPLDYLKLQITLSSEKSEAIWEKYASPEMQKKFVKSNIFDYLFIFTYGATYFLIFTYDSAFPVWEIISIVIGLGAALADFTEDTIVLASIKKSKIATGKDFSKGAYFAIIKFILLSITQISIIAILLLK